ncbi:unnamed protein product, partial [Strongylus vulgaris]
MHSMEMTDDEDDGDVGSDIVTSSPIILLRKNDSSTKILNRSGNCTLPVAKAQTKKLQVILSLLGEKRDSKDMKEIRKLISKWQNKTRIVTLEEEARRKEISKALQDLINKFDEVNLEVVKNAMIDDADGEDDENATIPCEQLSLIESDDEENVEPKHKFDRILQGVKNEVRDHVVIEEGVEKLILTGGDAQADLSIDAGTTNVQVDEKSEPMNKESDINH